MSRVEAQQLISEVAEWSKLQKSIIGLLLVGSFAKGSSSPESDIDLILLTNELPRWTTSGDWVRAFGNCEQTEYEDWIGVKTIRAFFNSGIEVEFNFATPEWANTDPVDPGTHRVVSDGAKVLYDPEFRLSKLVEAVKAR